MKANASSAEKTTDITGNQPPLPGQYHVVIKAANGSRMKKNGEALGADIVEYEVLAGTVPGQEGMSFSQFFWLDDDGNETDLHTRFALASDLVAPGKARDIDLDEEAPGRQLIVAVVEFKKKDGSKARGIGNFGYDLWHVNDPEVASVPKDKDALALLPKEDGSKAESPESEPAAAGSQDDDFSDV